LARGAHRRGLPRGQRASERLRLRLGRGAGRARRSRRLPASVPGHRCGRGLPATARFGGDGARREARRATPCARGRARRAAHPPTCTLRVTTAGARGQALPCARSPMLAGPPRPYMRVELTVNGETRTVEVEPRMSLLDCLRERLLLTGAHAGCEHGVCGACT